jgi:hypothetical protein
MIDTPTTLVLGAGASMDFGFPSGRGLLLRTIDDLGTPSSTLYQVLGQLGFKEPTMGDFRDALRLSRPPSVDALIETRPEFLEVGKAAIAAGLIPCEGASNVMDPRVFSWYDFLLGRLRASKPEDFTKNKLSVVTFNYDRSLEHFLFTTLQHTWNLPDAEVGMLMQALPIVHIYGQLGKFPPLNNGTGRAYGAKLTAAGVTESVAEMRVLHEGEKSPQLAAAQKLVALAKRVCFLGFGYLPINVDRLQAGRLPRKGVRVCGTAYELREGERVHLRKAFGPLSIHLGKTEAKVLDFLREDDVLT